MVVVGIERVDMAAAAVVVGEKVDSAAAIALVVTVTGVAAAVAAADAAAGRNTFRIFEDAPIDHGCVFI